MLAQDRATVLKRVDLGLALLDRDMPGWEKAIQLSSFNLADPVECIIGQLAGDFDTGAFGLGLMTDVDCVEHVFLPQSFLDEDRGPSVNEYEVLTAVWCDKIRERLVIQGIVPASELSIMTRLKLWLLGRRNGFGAAEEA